MKKLFVLCFCHWLIYQLDILHMLCFVLVISGFLRLLIFKVILSFYFINFSSFSHFFLHLFCIPSSISTILLFLFWGQICYWRLQVQIECFFFGQSMNWLSSNETQYMSVVTHTHTASVTVGQEKYFMFYLLRVFKLLSEPSFPQSSLFPLVQPVAPLSPSAEQVSGPICLFKEYPFQQANTVCVSVCVWIFITTHQQSHAVPAGH